MKQFKHKNHSYGKTKTCTNSTDKMEVKAQNNKHHWFLETSLNSVSLFSKDMLGNSTVNRSSFWILVANSVCSWLLRMSTSFWRSNEHISVRWLKVIRQQYICSLTFRWWFASCSSITWSAVFPTDTIIKKSHHLWWLMSMYLQNSKTILRVYETNTLVYLSGASKHWNHKNIITHQTASTCIYLQNNSLMMNFQSRIGRFFCRKRLRSIHPLSTNSLRLVELSRRIK